MTVPPALEGAVLPDRSVLIAQRCADCSACFFPPDGVCCRCGSTSVEQAPLAGTGTVYAWTVVRRSRPDLTAPYVVAWVDTPEGPRLFGQVAAPPDAMSTGMAVAVAFGAPPAGGPEGAFHFVPRSDGGPR